MVEIASTHKHGGRADLPIEVHPICSQTCCIRRLHGILGGACLSKAIASDLTKLSTCNPRSTCNLESGKRLYEPHTKVVRVQASLCRNKVELEKLKTDVV